MRKVLVLLPILILPLIITPVQASPDYEYIVVAMDEEFASGVFYRVGIYYPYLVNARHYSDWQLSRVFYHWYSWWGAFLRFNVIGYVEFDSWDYGDLAYTLNEAVEKTGFRNGIYFNGKRATILMVWTLQDNDGYGGSASATDRAIIVKAQEWWADDNVILHELTHLYIRGAPPVDTSHGMCLMSTTPVYMGVYSEPLAPDFGYAYLPLFQTQRASYFAYVWAECCYYLLDSVLGKAGGGASPEETIMVYIEELEPSNPLPQILFVILLIGGLIGGFLGIIFLISKAEHFKRKMRELI